MRASDLARVRVLIVDDSATMRGLIRVMLAHDPQIDVVGEAGGSDEARALIKQLDPDVITLDIEMPGMSGLEFLGKIMSLRPMPVVVVSSLTARGAEVTIQALEIGAFECFPKPANLSALRDDDRLARLVRAAAGSRDRTMRPARPTVQPSRGGTSSTLLAIGASTGGVEALLEVIGGLPADCPPTVIVQHMPALFTTSFANRLNRFCQPIVAEAQSGVILERGHVYLAPGGGRHLEVVGSTHSRIRLFEADLVGGHRPAVDVLFRSVAKLQRPVIGVILTGMGADGAAGLRAMRDAGARTIGQDEASCVVYGMPQAAFQMGAVERQLPLKQIAAAAMELSA